MTEPFPGMDPYLEDPAYWRDFHQRFITYWCDWLLDHLPEHYAVRIDERVSLLGEEVRWDLLPDLLVSQSHPLPEQVPGSATTTLDVEPITLSVELLDAETEAFLQVIHRPTATLVAVLELLSPTNKSGQGRISYLQKRNEILQDSVHLVELDLLRAGYRPPVRGQLPAGDYFALVSRGDRRPECEVYAWGLRAPLPRIRLPLRAPDADVVFDLPGLFRQAYRRGRYCRDLPYATAAAGPLRQGDQDWINERLRTWKAASSTASSTAQA